MVSEGSLEEGVLTKWGGATEKGITDEPRDPPSFYSQEK